MNANQGRAGQEQNCRQRASLLGCGVGLLVFWLGFITVDGNWWIMYLNASWNRLDPAFQNATLTLGTAVAVLLVATAREREQAAGHPSSRSGGSSAL